MPPHEVEAIDVGARKESGNDNHTIRTIRMARERRRAKIKIEKEKRKRMIKNNKKNEKNIMYHLYHTIYITVARLYLNCNIRKKNYFIKF